MLYPTVSATWPGGTGRLDHKYVILGGVLLLVAMGVGGWIIFNGTGGANANKPKLGDDAAVEQMIADDYPKDLTEWIEANPARMLGGMNAMQATMMERQLKKMGATKVLAFGAGVLCLVIAVELPDDPTQRKVLLDWHDQKRLPGDPHTKDVGQRYFLHKHSTVNEAYSINTPMFSSA